MSADIAVEAPASMLVPPPLSLYVHLPWCLRKCPYCDFNSHAVSATDPVPEARYVDALLRDLEIELPEIWGRGVTTVFLGGGTPSLFSPESVNRLLSGIRARVPLRPDAEITLEANPGAADSARLVGFVDAGVNRFSIGVQSFDDALLARIGRVHDGAAADAAVRAALASGAARVNLDLMFGLPGQSLEQAAADVERALALGVEHVSYYQLTLEPNTAFHRDPPALPGHDRLYEIDVQGRERLVSAGLAAYEVSAYARPGAACQHNLNVWRFGDYLGIGAGAHGKITLAARGALLRTVKHRHPRKYLEAVEAGTPSARRTAVPPRERVFEYLLNGLRLTEGISVAAFGERTGRSPQELHSALVPALRRELVIVDGDRVRATALGARFLDDVLADLLE